MRKHTSLLVFLMLSGTCIAQTLHPRKDLAFGQIAAGGGYESVLTVTNRGAGAYTGTFEMYTGTGLPWNPTINGTPTLSGMLPITLNPGETRTYRITLAGEVQSAYGYVKSGDLAQTSFIEGNLTYYVSSASAESGSVMFEGVGVPPSEEFFKTTIPFEDFSAVALALANINTGPSASVTLNVYSGSNQLKGTKSIPLGPHEHCVSFLYQQFSGLSMGSGRLDIESTKAVFGTALTFVPSTASPAGSLFSSLPMLPAPYAYTFRATTSGMNLEGELSLWANGLLVEGYIRLLKVSGLAVSPPETYFLLGQFSEGTLELVTFGTSHALGDQKFGALASFDGFGFTKSLQLGYFIMGNPITRDGDEGTINLVKSF